MGSADIEISKEQVFKWKKMYISQETQGYSRTTDGSALNLPCWDMPGRNCT